MGENMKKAYKYLTFIVVAVLGVACSKNAALDGPDGDFDAEPLIRFGEVTTKADEPVADDAKPLQIRVYDYFTKSGETTESVYINDLIQESKTAGTWVFVDPDQPNSYAWKVGDHEFFGWVAIDEEGNILTETEDEEGNTIPGLSASGKVLSLAETELPGSNNLDYRYAADTVVSWTKAAGGTPVELTMKHLSAALTYTFTNETNVEYVITGLTVKDIVTKASATVTYGGADGEVVAITPNATKNNIALDLEEGVKNTVWPQAVSGATLVIDYTVEGKTGTQSVTHPLPNTTWESGKVYNYAIKVNGKDIEIILTVLPWDEENPKVEYGEGPAVTALALEYVSGAAITSGGGRRRNNNFADESNPIKGYFSVYAPAKQQWVIKVTGDTDAIVVTSPQGTKKDIKDEEGNVLYQEIVGPINGRADFEISRGTGITASSTVKLYFMVRMTNSVTTTDDEGNEVTETTTRDISIDSEITRSNGPLTITGKIGQ